MKTFNDFKYAHLDNSTYLCLLQDVIKHAEKMTCKQFQGMIEAFKAIVESFGKCIANKDAKSVKRLPQILHRARINAYARLCDTLKRIQDSGVLKTGIAAEACNAAIAKCRSLRNLNQEKVTESIEELFAEMENFPKDTLCKIDAMETYLSLLNVELAYKMAGVECDYEEEGIENDQTLCVRYDCTNMFMMFSNIVDVFAMAELKAGNTEKSRMHGKIS